MNEPVRIHDDRSAPAYSIPRASEGPLLPTRASSKRAEAAGLDALEPLAPAEPRPLPTIEDFIAAPAADPVPASSGSRARLRRLSGGLIRLGPGRAEREHAERINRVQRNLQGPKTIAVVNPKGGSHKTTASLLLAATFGIHRGGYVLAWDANESRGTLGWRAVHPSHQRTSIDLLRDLDHFADPQTARIGDLDNYVRSQGTSQFDVLASDEEPGSDTVVDAASFGELHGMLTRFYRLVVLDTGTNMRAPAWEAAVRRADQLVIVSTMHEDAGASAAWLADSLRRRGMEEKVRSAVTVLSDDGGSDPEVQAQLHRHFGSLTRGVLEVPFDEALLRGGRVDVRALHPGTLDAWLAVAATVADGL